MNPGNGLVTLPSSHSVDETVNRLKQLLANRGLMLFTIIDHSGEAEKAGLTMPNTKLVIFGSPTGGTPLMLAAPSVAIDLPMKILIAEDLEGKVQVSYNDSEYLRLRHGISTDLMRALAGIIAISEFIASGT